MSEKNGIIPVDKMAGDYLQSFGKALSDYAIRDYNQTAFLKSAMLAIVDNANLSECLKSDTGKRSLFNALRFAATTGLSLNPQEGKSALIAYSGKIQYQVMKNGMIDLALESGKVDFISADYVKSNDKFSLKKSVSGDDYTFEPALKDRGEIIGYFAAMRLKSGSTHVKWFTSEEIDEHRKKYSSKSNMPIEGYGIKTALKAMLRSVSISAALDNAIGADDFFEVSLHETPRGASSNDVLNKLTDKKNETIIPDKQGDLL